MGNGKHLHAKLLLLLLLNSISAVAFSSTSSMSIDSLQQQVVISEIRLIGNKVTHPKIIYRELIFMKGDTLSLDLLLSMTTRSKENLMNTQLFNVVEMNVVREGNDKVEIIIIMTERWYIFPIPIFEVIDRNFNEWWKTRSIARTIYGLQIKWENFRGRNESLRISLRFGYTENISIYYNIPYLNKDQTTGLTFYTGVSRNHEVAYSVTNNKLNYYRNTGSYIKHDFVGGLKFFYRRKIHNTTGVFAEYKRNEVSDTILQLNNEFFKPGYKNQQTINVGIQFKRDLRDFVEYPLKGYYFDCEIVKQGFGQFRNEPDQVYMNATFKKFVELSRRWHVAGMVKGKITGQNYLAYNNTKALGYNADFVRGYEYYVVSGQNYVLLKSNLKYSILPVRVFKANYIPSEKFSIIPLSIHLNAFLDAGYVRDRQFAKENPLTNTWLMGYGMGIDLVTYYNIIIRAEYSFNKIGEKGLFIHFTAPI